MMIIAKLHFDGYLCQKHFTRSVTYELHILMSLMITEFGSVNKFCNSNVWF